MASEPFELEDAAVAELAGFTEALLETADDELCGTLEEDCAVAELDTTDELEEFAEDELETTEELEAGASFLATPAAANSGAWPALSASRAPAR